MPRRYDLDWVRICAFAVLVLYHTGMYYVSWDWHVKSPQASPTLEPYMLLSAPWRLSLLFLVSGAASAFLLNKARRNATSDTQIRFLGPRSWRLLPPLVFGMLVIVPPQTYYEIVEKYGYDGSYGEFYLLYLSHGLCRDGSCLDTPTWNHLWFVAYLWVYTALLWTLIRLAPSALPRLENRVERALSPLGVLLWPTAFFVLARLALVSIFESTHDLFTDVYNHVQYFGVFLLGFLIAASQPVWDRMQRLRWTTLILALSSWGFLAWYFSHYSEQHLPPDNIRMLQRVVWGINQWCSIAAILGIASALKPRDSRALRYFTPAVFPVYILHQTIIVVCAYQLRPLQLVPAVEGPVLIALTFTLSFAGYELIRRARWLKPLFGLK